MAEQPQLNKASLLVLDTQQDVGVRTMLFITLVKNDPTNAPIIVKEVLEAATNGGSNDLLKKKLKEVDDFVAEVKRGALAALTYIGNAPLNRLHLRSAGGEDHLLAPIPTLKDVTINPGETVLASINAGLAVEKFDGISKTGEVCTFEKALPDNRIEVKTPHGEETIVCNVSKEVAQLVKDGTLKSGAKVIVCVRRKFVFEAVPVEEDKLAGYRFLVRGPVPDILVDRDIGSPKPFIGQVTEHIRREMLNPEISAQYKLRRSATKMLTGVSGSGKSLSIQAIWRNMYEIMSEVTGISIDKLPPRVLRLRAAQTLSMWLGESDKQIDRFFDEVYKLADEKWVDETGKEWTLPVMVIGEEIEGLTRTRGGGGDSVYDRIQTTLLERLDATTQNLKDRLIIFMFTSNVSHLVDPAFMRRAGGTIERFTRCNRDEFRHILGKHIHGLAIRTADNSVVINDSMAENALCDQLTAYIYKDPVTDPVKPMAVLSYNNNRSENKYKSDFITGGLIDRAVQKAADVAVHRHFSKGEKGIIPQDISDALDEQIGNIVAQLHAHNAENYLDIPEGLHVTKVERAVR